MPRQIRELSRLAAHELLACGCIAPVLWVDRHVCRCARCSALSMHGAWQELGAGAAGQNADVRLQIDQHTSVHGGQCAHTPKSGPHHLQTCCALGMQTRGKLGHCRQDQALTALALTGLWIYNCRFFALACDLPGVVWG